MGIPRQACDIPFGTVNWEGAKHDTELSKHSNLFIAVNKKLAVTREDLNAVDKKKTHFMKA